MKREREPSTVEEPSPTKRARPTNLFQWWQAQLLELDVEWADGRGLRITRADTLVVEARYTSIMAIEPPIPLSQVTLIWNAIGKRDQLCAKGWARQDELPPVIGLGRFSDLVEKFTAGATVPERSMTPVYLLFTILLESLRHAIVEHGEARVLAVCDAGRERSAAALLVLTGLLSQLKHGSMENVLTWVDRQPTAQRLASTNTFYVDVRLMMARIPAFITSSLPPSPSPALTAGGEWRCHAACTRLARWMDKPTGLMYCSVVCWRTMDHH